MPRPEDERFHPRNDDPYWSESSWLSFMIPERNILGHVYFYHRPNMNHSAGGVIVWDGNGENHYDCLYCGWDPLLPIPHGAEMNDFTLDNSLTVKLIEPLTETSVRYQRDECELDLRWRAIMEPQEMKRTSAGDLNPGIQEWLVDEGVGGLSIGHWEQLGEVTGTVRVNDETFDVRCFGMRDRTWGPRPAKRVPRSSYFWGVDSESHHFMAAAAPDQPSENDPIDGAVDTVVAGWYMKDGVKGELVSGSLHSVERAEDGRGRREIIDALDHLGRELHAEGMNRSWLRWSVFSGVNCWWSLTDWELNRRKARGEAVEVWTFSQNRQFMRQRAGR